MVMAISLADACLAVDRVHWRTGACRRHPLSAPQPALGLKSTRIVVDAFGATVPTAEASPGFVRRSLPSKHRAGVLPSGSRFRLFLRFDRGTTAWCRAAVWPARPASL